ncbi:MAG: peptidase dimerization domain-containing protein, partial [Anaerovoracaceae bacterium]
GISVALKALRFEFIGKAAHAAAAPEKGINALDACITTFVNIGMLRQQVVPTARIHGIIRDGGTAANTIPEYACAEFYVRATSKSYLKDLARRVCACAEAGAAAAGARLEISEFETGNDNLLTNHTLQDCLCRNLERVGITEIEEAGEANGSTDVGNVSHVCPTIHPSFNIMAPGEVYSTHTVEFREATLREPAKEALMKNVCALAMTGKEILDDPRLLAEIRREFREAVLND